MIGATTGSEPDHVADGDLKSMDELRGAMKDIEKAKMSLGEKATVKGCMTEIEVLKDQVALFHEQLRRLIGMYQNLTNEFDQLKEQRVKELQVRINGGSTTPEDIEE